MSDHLTSCQGVLTDDGQLCSGECVYRRECVCACMYKIEACMHEIEECMLFHCIGTFELAL